LSDSKVNSDQFVGGHRGHVLDRPPHDVAAQLEDLLELPDVRVRAVEGEFIHLDHLFQHPVLDVEDGLAVRLGMPRKALRGQLGVVADQAVRPVGMGGAQDDRGGSQLVSVA
jgi:hypothetical protein